MLTFIFYRGLTTWDLYVAKKCFIDRKYTEKDKEAQNEKLKLLLKIVMMCLQMENEVFWC